MLLNLILSIFAIPSLIDENSSAIKANAQMASHILDTEMKGMNPDVKRKITNSLNKNTVDNTKYRHLFLIKKRTIDDGNREITEFDITERIVPKIDFPLLETIYGKATFIGILFLLAILVFTTTIRLYQNIIRLDYIRERVIKEEHEIPQANPRENKTAQ